MCWCNKENPAPICDNCPEEKKALVTDGADDPQVQKMMNTKVKVILIHKPSNQSASSDVALRDVRNYAERAIKAFQAKQPMVNGQLSQTKDFVVVEVGNNGSVRVSSIENL